MKLLDVHLQRLSEHRAQQQVTAANRYQARVETYKRRQQYLKDLAAARELEAELRPIARTCRRDRADCNHLDSAVRPVPCERDNPGWGVDADLAVVFRRGKRERAWLPTMTRCYRESQPLVQWQYPRCLTPT